MKLVVHQNFGSETPKKSDLAREYKRDINYSRPYTVVLDNLPTHKDLLLLAPTIASGKAVCELKIGVSVVHPNDMFVRKIGLQIAEANLIPELFVIKSLTIFPFHKSYDHAIIRASFGLMHKPELDFTIGYTESGRPLTGDLRGLGALAYELAGIHNKGWRNP